MKEQIIQYLIGLGFVQQDNVLTKHIEQQVGEIIINGFRKPRIEHISLILEYIGDGWIGESEDVNEPLTQWRVSVNDKEQEEILIYDLEEFKKIIH